MNDEQAFSDEFLSAFIDGQLDESERGLLLEALRKDDELSRRVCQLRKVRDMVQLGYLDIEAPSTQVGQKKTRTSRMALVASFLMLLGLAVGWTSHALLSDPGLTELAQAIESGRQIGPGEQWRVVLHVTTDDEYRLNTVLEETERLLKSHREAGRTVVVELLTNGKGLKLLRSDSSPFAERIHALQAEYDTLSFLACAKTIKRLKKEKGIDVTLLPEAEVVTSALKQIIRRKEDGWSYIRI
ncbi:MAG TPA: hypothetical protein ENJ01_10260 [Gammaproteobacteria bacterium]|nr:hypothetical protein [Gammaproteobacteria bacterium]